MILPMTFRTPTNEDIHTAFEQGEAAVIGLFHEVPTQVAELAQQLAKRSRHFHLGSGKTTVEKFKQELKT